MEKWTMKNGKEIDICEMEDIHLLNSIRLVERRMDSMKEAFSDLVNEAERRGINIAEQKLKPYNSVV